MHDTSLVFEAQPDWLTAATHHRHNSDQLAAFARALLAREQRDGNRQRPFRLQGYVGVQAGRVRLGERDNAALVQLSGELAAQHLHHVRELQDSLTRLDICVTCRPATTSDVEAARAYQSATAFRAGHPRSAAAKLVCDNDGGSTLYVGDRTSNYLLRLYNKGAERIAAHDQAGAERYAGAWRYELEVKGQPAPALARAVDEAEDQAEYIQSFIHRYCENHGISPIFPFEGRRAILPGFTRRSDRQKTLDWFRRSVAPGLRRVLDGSADQEVYTALGLDPSRIPNAPFTQSSRSVSFNQATDA